MLNVLLFCANINYILGASPETGVGRLISREKALHSSRRRLETVESVEEWELVLTLDGDGTPEYDVGEANFNEGFQNSHGFIIKRECPSCSADYQTIYYKRYTDPANFDAYGHMKDWSNINNVLGIDFNLYSTLSDALLDNKQNAWKYCNYNDPGIGAFRDCGKTGYVPMQWTSQSRGGQKASFYVYSVEISDMIQDLISAILSGTGVWSIQSISSGNYLNGRDGLGATNTDPADDKYSHWTIEQTNIGYAIKSASSGWYIDGRSADYEYPLLTDRDPSNDAFLNWEFSQTQGGYIAIKSISSNKFLDGRPGLTYSDPLDISDPNLQWKLMKYSSEHIGFEDGILCVDGITCNYCHNDATYWESKAHKACGTEPCWVDGTVCGVGTTCNKCCNTARDALGTKCGGDAWNDGTICGQGTTCNYCQNAATYWSSKAFTACGREPCWGDGTICGLGTTCNSCCNKASYWWKKAFTACGSD